MILDESSLPLASFCLLRPWHEASFSLIPLHLAIAVEEQAIVPWVDSMVVVLWIGLVVAAGVVAKLMPLEEAGRDGVSTSVVLLTV